MSYRNNHRGNTPHDTSRTLSFDAFSDDEKTEVLNLDNDSHPVAGPDTEPTRVITAASSHKSHHEIPASARSSQFNDDPTEVFPVRAAHTAPATQQMPVSKNATHPLQKITRPTLKGSKVASFLLPAQPTKNSHQQVELPRDYQTQVAPQTFNQSNPQAPNAMRSGLPSHIRQTRPSTWGIIQHLLAWLLIVGLLCASLWFFVLTPSGQQLDEVAFREYAYQFLTIQPQTATGLDQIPAAAGIFAVTGLLFVLIWKHRFIPAIVGIGVALASNATTQVIKNVILTKPNYGIQEATMNSAPSGHTTFAASAVAMLFLASPKRLRPAVGFIGMLFTLAAGYSTIINEWHRPVDVISGILVTASWTIVGLALLRFLRSEELDMSNTQRSGLVMIPLLLIGGFFLSFCAVAMYLLVYTDTMAGSAVIGATCMIAAVAFFSTAILIALLRPQNKKRKVYTKVWTY